MADLIDSHAHLTDERLVSDAPGIVERARALGVTAIITVGTKLDDSRAAVGLAATLPSVYAAVGIHPHSADQANEAAFDELVSLAASPGVVAVGETGLDFHYDNSPRDDQRRSFLRHLEMARALDLPVVVHSRAADAEMAMILRDEGRGTRGVLHCFSGGPDLLAAALDIDWYVSFAGMITFPKWTDAELLRSVPTDRLLVETDSPYLSPAPHRGRRNEPANVTLVASKAADLRGVDVTDLAEATTANALRLFRLPDPLR